MFIQTERTLNPATLKFITGRIVMKSGASQSGGLFFLRGSEGLQRQATLHRRRFCEDGCAQRLNCNHVRFRFYVRLDVMTLPLGWEQDRAAAG